MAACNLKDEKAVLLKAILEAGVAVKHLQSSALKISHKANNDIVTEADLLADSVLKEALMNAFPADGWLSEETVDNMNRLQCRRVWVVDPIDGTKEYAAGTPEYALSVALVEDGAPLLAAVFNPATDELFHAVKGEGCWLNNKLVTCNMPYTDKLILLASRSEYEHGKWGAFEKGCQVIPVGSIAYKLGLVAAGRAHSTFSLGPKSEWDIAAGVLLVQEAGGVVTDRNGTPFMFNRRNTRVSSIVAVASLQEKQLFDLISHH